MPPRARYCRECLVGAGRFEGQQLAFTRVSGGVPIPTGYFDRYQCDVCLRAFHVPSLYTLLGGAAVLVIALALFALGLPGSGWALVPVGSAVVVGYGLARIVQTYRHPVADGHELARGPVISS